MKIFFLGTDYPYPGFSGACVVNWSIVNYLVSQGHEVTLFVDPPRFGTNEIDQLKQDKMSEATNSLNCKVVNLKNIKKVINKKSLIRRIFSNSFEDYFPSCYVKEEIEEIIRKKIFEIKPDLLLCDGSPTIHWVRSINIKKAGFIHTMSLISYSNFMVQYRLSKFSLNTLKHFLFFLKAKLFDKKLISDANNIHKRFHHSKDIMELSLKKGLKDCISLYPPSFDNLNSKKRNIFKKQNRDYFKIIIVGLMSAVNRSLYDTLQHHVFPYLEKNLDMKKIQFHMIGTDHNDMPKYFQNKNCVSAKGFVEDFDLEIQDCDLFYCVTPYPLGLRSRLLDALNFGTAIITSEYDKKSLPFLEHNYNSYIAQKETDIGKLIIEIINDKNIENLKNNARKTYEKFLSFENAGKKYEEEILND